MEELKLLVDMVAHLPQMALWVIAAFWAYKVCVIGSIYGVIRLAIVKAHSWLTTPKHQLVTHDIRMMLDGEVISGAKDALAMQIIRLKNRRLRSGSQCVHQSDVDWLREAIDEKIAREVGSGKKQKAA